MRVLALTNLYPNPFQPQRATFTRHAMRILAESNAVRVIAPVAWTDEWSASRKGLPHIPRDRTVIHDGIQVEHPRYFFPPRILRHYYGQFFLASIKHRFRRVVTEFHPDLIYTPWAYPDGWAAVKLARRIGLPVVIKVVGSDILLLNKYPSRLARTLEAVRAADGVVAVSKDLANRMIDYGVPADAIRVIYDGVDHSVFNPGSQREARQRLKVTDGAPIVMFIGNLVPVKAVDVLLEACSLLTRAGREFRLFIIGEGPLRKSLQLQASKLGIEGRISFFGSRPHSELADWFRAADVFVLPSHSEGVPNVLLEASACGIPWVASRVGGIPEIAPLGSSKLVTPATPSVLAESIWDSLNTIAQKPELKPRSHAESVAELDRYLHEVLASHSRLAMNLVVR